jgi:hypothetical protein
MMMNDTKTDTNETTPISVQNNEIKTNVPTTPVSNNNEGNLDLSDLRKKLSTIENNIYTQPKIDFSTINNNNSSTSSLQEEIEKIKQTIKVWSGSPISSGKSNSRVVTLVRDPSDIPKYTEAQMQQMKKEATEKVLNEKNFMNDKYLQLQRQYEQELYVNRQFQEAIQEYENTITTLLDSHKKQEEKQKMVVSSLKLESENLKQKVSEYDKLYNEILQKHNLLKQEHLSKKEKEKELESQLLKTNQKLAGVEQEYQNLKIQYEKKINLANEKFKQYAEQQNSHSQLIQFKLQKNAIEINNLTNALSQKQKENKELVQLCDDLIKQLEGKK